MSLRSVAFAPISIASTPSAISSPAPGPTRPTPSMRSRLGIENQLGQAVGAIERDRRGPTRPTGTSRPSPVRLVLLRLRLGQAAQASSGSVKTTAGIARGANATFSPAITSTATRPSCDALCASIGSPTTSPIAKIDGSCGAPLLVDHDEAALDRPARACVSRPGMLRVRAGGRPTRARDRRAAPSGRRLALERHADALRLRPSSARPRLEQHALHHLADALARGRRRDRGRRRAAARASSRRP